MKDLKFNLAIGIIVAGLLANAGFAIYAVLKVFLLSL